MALITEMVHCNRSSKDAEFFFVKIKTCWPLNTYIQLAGFTAIVNETLESGI